MGVVHLSTAREADEGVYKNYTGSISGMYGEIDMIRPRPIAEGSKGRCEVMTIGPSHAHAVEISCLLLPFQR